MTMGRAGAAALMAAVLSGCGGGGGGADSCYYESTGTCSRYAGIAELASLEEACTQLGGSWRRACPPRPSFGTCTVTAGQASNSTVLYPGGACSIDQARALCAYVNEEATFTPGEGEASCGAASDQTVTCDCRAAFPGYCSTVSGSMAPERHAALLASCGRIGCVLLDGACPAATTGSCRAEVAGETEETQYYDPSTAASDQFDCERRGDTWSPNQG